MRKYLLLGVLCAVFTTSAYASCEIGYKCGHGVRNPDSQIIKTGTSFTIDIRDTCGTPSDGDYTFLGWHVTGTDTNFISGDVYNSGTLAPGSTLTIPFANAGDTCASAGKFWLNLEGVWRDNLAVSTPTSQTYVDDGLSHKLNKLANLGGTKMLMYSTSLDSAHQIGTPRDIVNTLGTVTNGLYADTSSDAAVERGVIQTAINGKQDASAINNGTEDYVVVYTNTPGQLDEKPVYGGNTNFSRALITAGTVNSAIVDAVNSELIQVDASTLQPSVNGTLWKLSDPTLLAMYRVALNTNTDGGGTCAYDFEDNIADGLACGVTELSRSEWQVYFTYGNVFGKSWCSDIDGGGFGTVADSATNATLEAQYNAWTPTNVAPYGVAGDKCWCRMDNVDGEPAVWKWVYLPLKSGQTCTHDCASRCAIQLSNGSNFRTPVFGKYVCIPQGEICSSDSDCCTDDIPSGASVTCSQGRCSFFNPAIVPKS
ncbi:MAG: hypothetical protein J6T57_04550 [Alphaproteobacteria bacterium]|nr:hypothetical protein [Alphaproteobacteria bacterium]